jgi:phosphate transport system permease protein
MASSKVKALFPFSIDRVFGSFLSVAGLSTGIIIILIMAFLVHEIGGILYPGVTVGGPGITSFFLDRTWNPLALQFNVLPMVVTSVAIAFFAVLLAVPLGCAVAAYITLYASKTLGTLLRRVMELACGIPSVVYGFWGLQVLVPWIGTWRPPGANLLAGTLILAMMILPTATLLIESAFRCVESHHALGVRSLGLGRFEILRLTYWPLCKSSVITAGILSGARAIGETMAVMMVCGNVVNMPGSIFDPVRTLTANIALELGYAEGFHRHGLFFSGFLLMALVLILLFGSAIWERRHVHP